MVNHFALQKGSKKPLYQQIIESVERAIVSGELLAGARLPSERELSGWLKVNRSTVIRAFDELAERNIIVKKAGSGTFVNDQKWGLLTYPSLNWRKGLAEPFFQAKTPDIPVKNAAYDLRSGDLPIDLYPDLQLPEIDWHALIKAEQADDGSQLGVLSLRETVREYLQARFDFSVPVEQILITSGTQQAISLIALGLLKPGDAIGIEEPSYFYTLPIFQSVGLRIYGIPMDQQGIVIDKLDELVHKHSLKMIFVNPNFQNPTGTVMSRQRKQALVSYCERKRLPMIEDDAYSQLSFYSTVDTTPMKKLDPTGDTIYLGSLSKYLGKSIRIGWMIAPEAVVNNLANIRHQLDSGLSALPQVMAENYLKHHALQHEEHLRNALSERAKACVTWLKEHLPEDYQYSAPLGGFHLYLTHKAGRELVGQTLVESLLRHNILAVDGDYFGADHTQKSARVSFVHFTHVP